MDEQIKQIAERLRGLRDAPFSQPFATHSS